MRLRQAAGRRLGAFANCVEQRPYWLCGLLPRRPACADEGDHELAVDLSCEPKAWDYGLGNHSALEWILDQYKEKKPKDPTIREKFDTYRFADYKEKVIDLLMRVTQVSVQTQAIVEAMRKMSRYAPTRLPGVTRGRDGK
jgi:hypothetical protein